MMIIYSFSRRITNIRKSNYVQYEILWAYFVRPWYSTFSDMGSTRQRSDWSLFTSLILYSHGYSLIQNHNQRNFVFYFNQFISICVKENLFKIN